MATAGDTAEPTYQAQFFGLNSVNVIVSGITLPSGGPWRVTRGGAYFNGVGAAATARIVIYSAGGSLLTQSASFSTAGPGFSLSGSQKYEADVSDITVAGGTTLLVGFWRHPSDTVQNSYHSGGSRIHDTQGSSPGSLGSFSNPSGRLGCYLVYELANSLPTAPTLQEPDSGETVHTGRTITYDWTHNDPDGNPQSGYNIQIRPLGGSVIDDYSATTSTTQVTRTLPSGHYAGDQQYEFRVRTKDAAGYGPFSGWRTFRPNSLPTASTPSTPSTSTLTPTITGGFSDPDPGSSMTAFQYVIERWTGSAWTSHYTSAELADTTPPWAHTYNGPALAWSTKYRVKARQKDEHGGWSAYSGWREWTTAQPAGPTYSAPSETALVTDLTPAVTINHTAAFDAHETKIYADDGVTIVKTLDETGTFGSVLTRTVSPAAPDLTPGTWYRVGGRVRVGGVWTAVTSPSGHRFRTNATPTGAPITRVYSDAGVDATVSPTGVRVTTDTTPRLSLPFADPDKVTYGDTPASRQIEIRRKDTLAALSGYPNVAAATEADHIVTSAMTLNVEYEARVGYRDAGLLPSASTYVFGPYLPIKASAAPTVGLSTPGSGSSVSDSTPTLGWTYSGSGGKVQRSYQVRIFDKGPTGANYTDEELVHDSGEVLSTATTYDVPFGVLSNGHDWRWEVDVRDSDGLLTRLT